MKNKQDLSNEEILELGLFVSHAPLLQDEKQNKRHRHQPVKKERFKIFEWGKSGQSCKKPTLSVFQ